MYLKYTLKYLIISLEGKLRTWDFASLKYRVAFRASFIVAVMMVQHFFLEQKLRICLNNAF